jgi:FtsZ-binding cell division protein ZapB
MITLASAVIEYYHHKLLVNSILKIIKKLYKKEQRIHKTVSLLQVERDALFEQKKWQESVSAFSSVDNKYLKKRPRTKALRDNRPQTPNAKARLRAVASVRSLAAIFYI